MQVESSCKLFISRLSAYYITEPFSPFYLEEMKVLSFSRTVNQLIMRVRKPNVEYKLALQLDPREHLDVLL